jgi:hypothetical protein
MQNNTNKKCEACSMISTHSVTDVKNVTHYFCTHHSLSDILKNNSKENKYKKLIPLAYVFLFIFSFPLIRQIDELSGMLYMMDFMGIFFLIFGLFKLIDLHGFVTGFKEYDFMAKRFKAYGYVYPFIEIGLGIMYLLGLMLLWQNILVFILAGIGIYTAYKYIDRADEIHCVCLGTVFKLPMTWITLSENLLMLVMVIFMMLM